MQNFRLFPILERAQIVMLGAYEEMHKSNGCCDVACSSKGDLIIACKTGVDIIDISSKYPKIVKSITLVNRAYTVVVYDTYIYVGVFLAGQGSRTEIITYDSCYTEVRRWKAKVDPCDFTVIDGKIFFSNLITSNLKVYNLLGEEQPEILWNGTSAGIVGIPPKSVALADQRYNTVYKKQVTGGQHNIVWTVNITQPFSMCVDANRSVWIRSNATDSITIISDQGKKLPDISWVISFTSLILWMTLNKC